MTFATVAWGIVWGSLGVSKLGWHIPETWVYAVAFLPASIGLAYALMTVRAKRAWLFMAVIAVFANGSLLALPFLFGREFADALS